MNKLTLALDWTPNINHIGFFVASEKGFYQDNGIDLKISDPSEDNYALTPAKKVEKGLANFALCPTESLISYRTKANPFGLIAIACIFKEDVSAIAVKEQEEIESPKDLDGKTYASYQARYEDEIVKQMIRNDGGEGDIRIEYPDKLGIWDAILNGPYDATWVFLNWEGVQAASRHAPLQYFRMKDYGIPYSYSPVIATGEKSIPAHQEAYENFLAATRQGYLYAVENPEEAIALLQPYIPEKDQDIDLTKALDISSRHFGDNKTWGSMDEQVVTEFLDWIYDHELESHKLDASAIITNELLLEA